MPGIDYDGDISRAYSEGRSLRAEAMATWREAIRHAVPSSGSILDVGAGTGRFAYPLAGLARRAVIAVEPATGMRSGRNDDDSTVSWVAGSAEALPIADGAVGLVWTAFTAHYFDLPRAAREFRRVAIPGGRVLVWHAFPDVFDDLEWFRWFPEARAIDEDRIPSVSAVMSAFESEGLRFAGRTNHAMRIADDMSTLAERLSHRSISTLHLISDADFDDGLDRLRAYAARSGIARPVYATNVMLEFAAGA